MILIDIHLTLQHCKSLPNVFFIKRILAATDPRFTKLLVSNHLPHVLIILLLTGSLVDRNWFVDFRITERYGLAIFECDLGSSEGNMVLLLKWPTLWRMLSEGVLLKTLSLVVAVELGSGRWDVIFLENGGPLPCQKIKLLFVHL